MPNLPLNFRTFADTLTATGEQTDDEKRILCKRIALFVYTVTDKQTNVKVGIRVSMEGTAWAVAPGVSDVTHTVNGTYALQYDGAAPYVSLLFVSESGGTNVVVTVNGVYVD